MVGKEGVGRAQEDSQSLREMSPAILKEGQECVGLSLPPPPNLPPVPGIGQT